VSEAGSAARSPSAEVLDALSAYPGGRELLALAGAREDAALVGGATRDLLLGRPPRELDVVVAGDGAAFAQELAAAVGEGASITTHQRFGTAVVEWEAGRVDIAERRAESYPLPGALPEVRPGTTEEDLERRDFTVHAIAVSLGGPRRAELHAVEGALEDLAAGRLRVLHERSFIDDPTRLLRLARYGARLGFAPERRTAELAAEALAGGALQTVSRARLGAELRLALTEPDPLAALTALDRLGALAALDPRLSFDEDLARRALQLLPEDGRTDALALGVLLLPLSLGLATDAEPAMFELLDGLEFIAADRGRAVRTAMLAPALLEQLASAERPSEILRAAGTCTLEAVALAGALASERSRDGALEAAAQWLQRWRHVHLAISGEDLLAAGVPPGPEVGLRLAAALNRRLDGELAEGPAAELDAALEARV
jgi:tRNA nucleotidyltransferase (CCA-adding enzyme)